MRNRGFTLIEMLVVIALVAVVGIMVAEMFFGQHKLYQAQFSELIVLNDARSALDEIDNYVRGANHVLDVYNTFTSDSDTLILQVQSIDATNQLVPGAYDVVVFYLQAGGLYREVIPNVASVRPATIKQLAGNVTALNFVYNDANFTLVSEVNTTLTATNTNPTQTRSATISSKSHLRNY